jgi:hypothetical protein
VEPIGHESEDRLELYALGRLRDTESAAIEEHLLVCEACRETLDGVGDCAITLRGELKRRSSLAYKPFLDWLRWPMPRFALAGAFGTAVLALGLYEIRPGIRVAPLASLQLTAMRGEMRTIGPAREFDLKVTDAPATGAPFRLQLVDGRGATIWKGTPITVPQGLEARVKDTLSPGDYFVRLYSASGKLLHEYGFRVRS